MNNTLIASALFLISLPCAQAADDFETAVRDASLSIRETMQKPSQGPAVEGAMVADAQAPKKSPYDNPDCAPEGKDDPKIYTNDFRWDYTLPEMKRRFTEMYKSDKRLAKRAFWNAEKGRLELPLDASWGGNIALSERLVRAVARHIERAYEKKYIDAVFFPDMGHSHLLIPKASWESKYSKYGVPEKSKMYADLFDDPDIRIFYHTAEQLKTRQSRGGPLVDDPRTQFRYKTRNIAGPNTPDADLTTYQNPESDANTVREIPGFFWYGGGFNLSANENGCFSYTADGKTFRFDISMDDLGPDPAQSGGGGDY